MPGIRDEALMRALAAEVKARRASLEISQEELAHRAGLSPLFIARIETARNQPSISSFLLLAEGLGSKAPELLAAVLVRHRRERKHAS